GLPQVNGEKPHLLVTVSYETLINQLGAAELTWAGPIGATDARLVACDCALIPAVLNSVGEVLDIGRKSRIWPTAIRRAIELRDKSCRHVDCTTPTQHCDIHHRIHWADGGPTDYHNGVLACRHHHTQIHKYGATYRDDGRFATTRTPQRRE
ncbi:MAG: HNH endonuclease signature motif containing protein, partial [Gammaproteobacteria bacterium]